MDQQADRIERRLNIDFVMSVWRWHRDSPGPDPATADGARGQLGRATAGRPQTYQRCARLSSMIAQATRYRWTKSNVSKFKACITIA